MQIYGGHVLDYFLSRPVARQPGDLVKLLVFFYALVFVLMKQARYIMLISKDYNSWLEDIITFNNARLCPVLMLS